MGRWSSEAYLLYVGTPVDTILSVAARLAMDLVWAHLPLILLLSFWVPSDLGVLRLWLPLPAVPSLLGDPPA